MPAVSCVLYAVMVLALSFPPPAAALPESGGRAARARRAKDAASSLCALASAYALPWSGIPWIPSAAWFPLALAALLLLPAREGRGGARSAWRDRAPAVASVGVFLLAARGFMLRIGTPGELCSLEGMSAVFRLESLGPWLLAAQAALFVGIAAAFALTDPRGGLSASLFFFSCAGFLTSVFISPLLARASIAMGIAPPRSIAVQILAALFAAALLGKLLGGGRARTGAPRRLLAGVAVFFVLSGCAVLAIYR